MLDNAMFFIVILSLYGNLLVIQKNHNGFLLWTGTNTAWIVYDLYIGVYSQAALFFVYNIFAVYGYLLWRYPSAVQFWKFIITGYIRNIIKER